jgi:HNH endonuclease
MRLLKEMPTIEKKIADGRLSLSVVSQAQTFFRKEAQTQKPLTIVEKQKVLESLENKSAREAEHKLLTLSSSPEAFFSEKIRPRTGSHSELKLLLSEDTLKILEKIRGLLAHSRPHMSYSELIEYMAKLTLDKIDPAQRSARSGILLPTQKPTKTVQDRFISAALKRSVWQRDEGRCTYQDSQSGRKCRSQYALQIDHIRPLALGGSSTLENLRLLCANHNQLEADQLFGREWMDKARASRSSVPKK